MLNLCKNKSGFTLVELMVSTAILVIILSFVLANFRGAAQNDLDLALQKVISDFREAQTMGLAGKIFVDTYPAGGYGLKVSKCLSSPCSYQLFADLNSNVYPDSGEVPTNFERSLLNNNFIKEICYSASIKPQFPPFDSSGRCSNTWLPVGLNFFAATFNQNQISIRTIPPPPQSNPTTGIKYIAVLIENKEVTDQFVYFYISQPTGLISSGLLLK